MNGTMEIDRVDLFDWAAIAIDLDSQGWAVLPSLLTGPECNQLAGLYGNGQGFRSHVVMARHGFGQGEYRYFAYPLPSVLQGLRTALYLTWRP